MDIDDKLLAKEDDSEADKIKKLSVTFFFFFIYSLF